MHLKLIEWIVSGLIPPPRLVYRVLFGQGGPQFQMGGTRRRQRSARLPSGALRRSFANERAAVQSSDACHAVGETHRVRSRAALRSLRRAVCALGRLRIARVLDDDLGAAALQGVDVRRLSLEMVARHHGFDSRRGTPLICRA